MLVGNGTATLHDPAAKQWLLFRRPLWIGVARSADQVMPLLRHIEEQVERERRFAVGFLAYEAAPAFDAAFRVKSDPEFPLAWFALYEPPRVQDHLPLAPDPGGTPIWQLPISPDAYASALERIRDLIRSGDTYQVNFTIRARTAFAGKAPGLFARLIQAQGAQYAAFIDTDEWAVCSASPELFFQLNGEELVCRPMKGTARRGLWPAQDAEQSRQALRSEKNQAENIMIVDMVRNDLGRIAKPGTVSADDLFAAEKYPTLWQMTSTVRCATTAGIPAIFRALFPAASITGAPKVRTMQIISELEENPRRIYTGAIGCLRPGRQAQFNVAIRTVLIDKRAGQAEYGVGGGIVWDSVPEQEYEECRTKMQILANPLPNFELLETIRWTPAGGYFLLESHLDRLGASAEYFSIPLSLDLVREQLRKLHPNLPEVPHRVRLRVDRHGDCVVEKQILSELPPPRRVGIAAAPIDSQNVLLYHKTTHREIYRQALSRARGCDDVLLWNEKGELTESTVANLVVEKGGRLLTPLLECGLLPGIYRGKLLKERRIHEESIRIEHLVKCARLFLVNSVRGMWEVALALGQGSLPPPAPATGAKLRAGSDLPTAEAKTC